MVGDKRLKHKITLCLASARGNTCSYIVHRHIVPVNCRNWPNVLIALHDALQVIGRRYSRLTLQEFLAGNDLRALLQSSHSIPSTWCVKNLACILGLWVYAPCDLFYAAQVSFKKCPFQLCWGAENDAASWIWIIVLDFDRCNAEAWSSAIATYRDS